MKLKYLTAYRNKKTNSLVELVSIDKKYVRAKYIPSGMSSDYFRKDFLNMYDIAV